MIKNKIRIIQMKVINRLLKLKLMILTGNKICHKTFYKNDLVFKNKIFSHNLKNQ